MFLIRTKSAMTTQLRISGLASTLLALATLLAASARAVDVTTVECQERGAWGRRRVYPTDSDATVLRMNHCHLTKINPDIFTGLPNLKNLYLYDNNIENINLAVFHPVHTLTSLSLQYNKLRELPVFDERSCANWTELLLDGNKITVIDNAGTFSACAKLQRLDLHDNGIEFIHPNVLRALTDLGVLYLNDNKIRFVPDQLFINNVKLTLLTLTNNRITHLPADFASRLRRAGANLRYFDINDNPWHCACLLELLADVHRGGVIIYKRWNLYNGALRECNFIGMYPCRRDAPSGLLRLAPRAALGAAS